jgi:predicted dehydrogenase
MDLCNHTRQIMKENKLFVGVIGTGEISDIYLKNISQKFGNLELEAIASKHFENAVKKAKEYGIKAQTTEELIHNPKVDLI